MWVPTMKVGMYVWQRHFWSLTYTFYWVKLLLAVCGTKPICVWFTKLFLTDVWSLFVDITFSIQQCFLLCVIRVTGCWTTSGFNRVRVNLDCSMVIQDKKVIYSVESYFEEFERNKSEKRGSNRRVGQSLMYNSLNCNCICCLYPFCRSWGASLLKNCPDCSFFS